MRGGKGADVLCERFPQASCSRWFMCASVSPTIERLRTHVVRAAPPLVKRLYRHYLPLFPTAIEQFSFDRFDLVVSLSHCCAKSIVHPARVKHLAVTFDADAYAWISSTPISGRNVGTLGNALMRPVMARLVGPRHGRPCGPLCRYLSLCCGEDPPIL
jgi:hypothetical protein